MSVLFDSLRHRRRFVILGVVLVFCFLLSCFDGGISATREVIGESVQLKEERQEQRQDPMSEDATDEFKDKMQPLLQRQAQLELDNRDRTRVFNTDLSTKENVMRNGFPTQWNSCTMQRILEAGSNHDDASKMDFHITNNGSKTVHLVILGGSATARTGDDCEIPGQELGRYSDILQSSLSDFASNVSAAAAAATVSDERDGLVNFKVSNLSHGTTDTLFTALQLDSWLDATQTDIILWEFSINDNLLPDKQLDFWFKRVYQLYTSAGKSPPPIIMTYLWGKMARVKRSPNEILKNGTGSGSLTAQWRIIEKYKNLGWNIQVINVGATIRKKAVSENPALLWDDNHHASCGGLHLISNMILHTILIDMTTCNIKQTQQMDNVRYISNDDKVSISDIKTKSRSFDDELSEIQQRMFHRDTRFGSHTVRRPNAGTSILKIVETNDAETTAGMVAKMGKAVSTRRDRMWAYRVPKCSKPWLNFTVVEPDLQWLVFSFGVNPVKDKTVGTPIVYLDSSERVPLEYNRQVDLGFESRWDARWIHVPKSSQQKAFHTISVCGEGEPLEMNLAFILGLMYA